jgi:hypothetical protein
VDSARATALDDWAVDRQGHDFLDAARFTQAWFQLADLCPRPPGGG